MADDLMRMQRQAAQRVQQMQAHSRRVFEAYQGREPVPIGDAPWEEPLHSPGLYARCDPPPTPPPSPATEPPAEAPAADRDQWLLLGLAALLWQSGCHTELMLALLYLAL